MALVPILEPVAIDWPSVLPRVQDDDVHESIMARIHLGHTASLISELFSLRIPSDEEAKIKNWLSDVSTKGATLKELMIAMLTRAPICRPEQVAEVARLTFFDPGTTSPSGESYHAEPMDLFPTSNVVRNAWRQRAQAIAGEDNVSREEIWTNLIEPFARSAKLWICDPYSIARAVDSRNPMESGLAFYIRRLGDLAAREGQLQSVTVLSSQPNKREREISKQVLQDLADDVWHLAGGFIRVDLCLTPWKVQGERPIHDRYFLAGAGGNILRVLHCSDSWVADANRSTMRNRLSQATLMTHQDQIRVYERDWNRAKKRTVLKAVARRAQPNPFND